MNHAGCGCVLQGECLSQPPPPLSVQEIEAAILELPPHDLAKLAEWFEEYRADEWDRQIAADAEAGRLDALIRGAEGDIAAGRARPLP
jgi:hypothetical protein